MDNALVSDFDGTITRNDFYVLVAQHYLPNGTPDYFALYRQGKLSHFDAMASYFAHTPTDEAAFNALLHQSDPDPDLAAVAQRLGTASWDLIIVSAGSSFYIRKILSAAGVHATVHSNPGRLEPGRGLIIERPLSSPFFSPDAGIDKAAVVRDALARYKKVAFAGDGPPDVEPALLVAPGLRFARSFLAGELLRRGEAFRPYTRWSEVVEALL